jgi:hypothetical protein
MELEAKCRTTAMGIMPHLDIDKALELASTLDIPFWPQLPKVSFYEDMYVQASENFPGIIVDSDNKKLSLDTIKFEKELSTYSERMRDPTTFALSRNYSAVYHRFLEKELENYYAIRGQTIGPISFGFKTTDENNRPIIYDDGIRTLLFDFIQRKTNTQYQELRQKNHNAFVWLDEPGLGWVFSGLSGYNDMQTREEYQYFLNGMEGPRALHLCANVNLPYLLNLGVEILSFDSYQIEVMPKGYASAIAEFIEAGGIISWGIVPIDSGNLEKETSETLARLLSDYWEVVSNNTAISAKQIAEQALIAPARCCLKDIGQVGAPGESLDGKIAKKEQIANIEERLVGKAFALLPQVSQLARNKYGL